MSAFCRLITAVALLLHLFFGCAMHHVVACGGHGHDGIHEADGIDCSLSVHAAQVHGDDQPGVEVRNCCERHQDESHPQSLAEKPDFESELICVGGCGCHSQPCDDDHPGCHGGVGCSFLNSNDVQFVIELPVVVSLETQTSDRERQALVSLTGAVADDVGWTAMGSQYHCALLCTWVI